MNPCKNTMSYWLVYCVNNKEDFSEWSDVVEFVVE